MKQHSLGRQLGLIDAVLLGLGSIIGTGVFVSIGVAAGVAGPVVILATAIAALVATSNALNSAQLAASHPVSGGTYEYGYRYLSPWLGFSAGWMFLCAKTASAATAALGFAGYATNALGIESRWIVPIATVTVVGVTLLVHGGIRRSSRANTAIVSVALLALIVFCVTGLPAASRNAGEHIATMFPLRGGAFRNLLEATALMFVAYTGYGRIATLGEEVVEPRRTIPRAIVITLVVSGMLYVAVAVVAVAAAGADRLSAATQGQAAPLTEVARLFDTPGVSSLVACGAIAAMLGVLLNLVLGLSRVVLAMARRRDLPRSLSRIDEAGQNPGPAVVFTGLVIFALTLVGDVKATWSFSAFTVLVYYAITNLAAFRLPESDRLYPRWLAATGLAACLALAFFVEPAVWATGLTLLAAGLVWHFVRSRQRVH